MAEDTTDEYELLPHKEIEELKDQLAKLKEFEITPSKKMQVSLLELNTKLDKLLDIFSDAAHEMRIEEGGLHFTEKMQPVLERMNRILEQNAEIAQGILAIADMLKGERGEMPERPPGLPPLPRPSSSMHEAPRPSNRPGTPPSLPPLPPTPTPAHASMPPIPPAPRPPTRAPGTPPLPPLPRKRTFGL